MNRKLAPALLILLIALICPALFIAQAADTGATALPDHITLTWTGNPSTSMTITWRTDTTITTGSIQYCSGDTLLDTAQRVEAKSYEFATDLGKTTLFSATLNDLAPGTRYSYRVGNDKKWSNAHTFSTADPEADSFMFLVFGDSQSAATGSSPYGLWRSTVQNAYRANPDAKFMVNVGDLVDAGQSGAHWNGWFSAAADVIDKIPIMPVVGNHETTGSPFTRRPAYWNAQFRLPQNGPSRLKNQVYSYDYGSVHFVVLDSQQSEQKQYGDILVAQKKWLAADLAASKAKWKIAFFHKGAYSLKNGRDNKAIREAFCPAIEKHNVDLVFNAHDHGIGRTYRIKNGVRMSEASEGTVYYVAGRSGSKVYHDVQKQDWNTFFYNPQDQPNYFVVEVSDDKLTIKTKKTDGALIDEFTINKTGN